MDQSKQFSFTTRQKNLARISDDVYDVAIIGGGITGAGVARDAASRGMKVVLIEAQDFAAGTSSRSSKLIHGGIRYLENLEFHLVFEALSERQRLFELAPHLVHPLRFLLPVYSTGRVPAWKLGLGMWVYDALSLFEAPELNQYLDLAQIRAEFPFLQSRDLDGAFAYYDAYMDDDRLVLETLRSAAGFGATCVNYVKATGAIFDDGKVRALECADLRDGDKKFTVHARHFVSTVGPWTDRLRSELFSERKKTLRPSKGVHLTFLKSRLKLKDAVVMGAENRIVFAIPRHEMVIVGTTDTDYPGDPKLVRAEEQDVAYLMGVVDRYFPGARLTRADIVGCYAGVRPLIDDGAQTESKTSREHAIWTDNHGVTFVAGGKYTTYRNMAEQTVTHALGSFAREDRARFAHGSTLMPLNPLVTTSLLERARREHARWAQEFDLPVTIARELADRHGMEAYRILEESRDLRPHASDPEGWMWCAEARHAVDHTMCLTLADFYLRRTHLILARPDHGMPFAESVARTMGERLGWTKDEQTREINALQNQLAWELDATISG